MKDVDIPKPGSDEAIESGCTCPVMDNGHGKGFDYNGHTSFWITSGCPLHGSETVKTSNMGILDDREE